METLPAVLPSARTAFAPSSKSSAAELPPSKIPVLSRAHAKVVPSAGDEGATQRSAFDAATAIEHSKPSLVGDPVYLDVFGFTYVAVRRA